MAATHHLLKDEQMPLFVVLARVASKAHWLGLNCSAWCWFVIDCVEYNVDPESTDW
jgi:hypothetical protein